MFYFYNLTGKKRRRQVVVRYMFIISSTHRIALLNIMENQCPKMLTFHYRATKTRSVKILCVFVARKCFYGVNLSVCVTHVPFCPSREQRVMVARSLCPLGS